MGGMKELWERQQQRGYPTAPGWKDPGISRENAERIGKEKLSDNMKKILSALEAGRGTADELGERVGLNPFQARPACTHLMKLNLIERTPERRTGAGGGTAAVLKLKDRIA